MKFLEKFGIGVHYLLIAIGLSLIFFVYSLFDVGSNRIFGYIFSTAPIWLPIITFLLFFEFWLGYVRTVYDLQQGRTTLEIKLPQEILKSPQAMELVLTQMHQAAAPDNHVQTYWDGKHAPTFSLELVSRGGDLRFYINTPTKKFKNLIETQLYAQYPGIEVVELNVDYTAEVPWDPANFFYFALHFGLKKADAYPLKSYIDFGLDKMPKEEEKIDPITTMLETLANLNPGEHYWVQILITANREIGFKEGSLKKIPDWKKAARKEIQNIMKAAAKERGGKEEGQQTAPQFLLTEDERDKIKSIERSLSKSAFDVAIRGMYIAKSDIANPGERIGPLIAGWRSYDDLNRNAIGVRWRTDFDWNWWQDPRGRRKEALKKQELQEYKMRAYMSKGDGDKHKVMTTEELATIFHLPGRVATTPTLARIPSKRAEAPSNLPS